MQIRLRKRRCSSGNAYFKIQKASGFKKVGCRAISALFLVIFFFSTTSCSLFEKKQLRPPLKKSLEKVCFTGEGRGRIEYSGGKHLFSFESLNEPKKNQWSLALELPIGGEELIRLSYLKKNLFKGKAKGLFIERLLRGAKKREDKRLILSLLENIGVIIALREGFYKLDEKESFEWFLEGGLFALSFDLGQKNKMIIEAFGEVTKAHYSKLRIMIVDRFDPLLKKIRLDLFFSSCK